MSLKQLINGQDVKFDTHQSGDGQEVKINNLHLEKILHKPKGIKIKYHLYPNSENQEIVSLEKQNSKVNKDIIEKITNEVKEALKKNKHLLKSLAETIITQLKKFNNGQVTEKEAENAAHNIASYFGLDEEFVKKVVKHGKEHNIISFQTIHTDKDGNLYSINQSKYGTEIKIEKEDKRNYMAALRLSNGYQSIINNLGVKKPLSVLSEKRVTTAVRATIKSQYPNAKVSCSANFSNGQWTGICEINGRRQVWTVQ